MRTSSATTANPDPASPARAASTAALRARMFVWNAISSMDLMMLEIPELDSRISSMAIFMSLIWDCPSSMAMRVSLAILVAEFADLAFARVISASDEREVLACSMAADSELVESAIDWLWRETMAEVSATLVEPLRRS